MSIWVSLGAPRLERFTLSANWLGRAGRVGGVRASRDELSLELGLDIGALDLVVAEFDERSGAIKGLRAMRDSMKPQSRPPLAVSQR